ncbi:uroporphyrinogen-III C-methyltransferase [Maritimibacter sp. 55A14]|uniref:uroporphyrinogen-III C-methyltransferase n=1 Tax=Maritimibacter sp. 55A14 TaxID=2174844 RepID=UPI000D61BE03|nr:uroporphyrinogen-III C-methyltransferase [Maritimibacter sp. 55A14]PWE34351.1 uroporphyrinogen-III C-methyltransferase [Maritimibacter sp. 55A14]
MKPIGKVFLVGAGPGDPGLLTLRAARLIENAEVIVHDRLVSPEIMALAPPQARLIPVGKAPRHHPVPQARINEILIRLALEGRTVLRLKGGDPFIFGRGSEEAAELRDMGVPVEVVPGITAAQGAASATGVPLTHRGLATGVRYVTGHCRAGADLALDWEGLADPDTTLVIYMGVANIGRIAAALHRAGLDAETPVMAVAGTTTPQERRLISSLGRIAGEVSRAGLAGPVLFIAGRVVSLYPGCPASVLAALAAPARTEPAHV